MRYNNIIIYIPRPNICFLGYSEGNSLLGDNAASGSHRFINETAYQGNHTVGDILIDMCPYFGGFQ